MRAIGAGRSTISMCIICTVRKTFKFIAEAKKLGDENYIYTLATTRKTGSIYIYYTMLYLYMNDIVFSDLYK